MALPKNIRNYQAYLAKKKRGPVKAFFHITKNENVPAIEKAGLLANHPNANINSAFQPFRKHGSKGGGVWVTTEPTAFPVYGTTIGGKSGDASARADALSTFKIEVPKAELPKMLAVQDPYGRNILRKGNDPRAIEPFYTWAGTDVPTTVFLNDMKPAWLKNLGYVEEHAPLYAAVDTESGIMQLKGSWGISPDSDDALLRALNKSDLYDYSGNTGHQHGWGNYEKSPKRFVDDYINWNRPITHRLPIFPAKNDVEFIARIQNTYPQYKQIVNDAGNLGAEVPANEYKRFSVDFIPAADWTEKYRDYIKPGERNKQRSHKFAPGAISRGMGGLGLPAIIERNFDWNKYNRLLSEGDTPHSAAFLAQPNAKLDWDNIEYDGGRYEPRTVSAHDYDALSEGAISRGIDRDHLATAQEYRTQRKAAARLIRRKRDAARKHLSRELGRLPTAEELDAWARYTMGYDIEYGKIPNPPDVLNRWAAKFNPAISIRISNELYKRIMERLDRKH